MLTYTLLSMLAISAPADRDEAFVHIAATHCKNAKKPVDKRLLRGMMQLETWLKVPKYARGITLAAACRSQAIVQTLGVETEARPLVSCRCGRGGRRRTRSSGHTLSVRWRCTCGM